MKPSKKYHIGTYGGSYKHGKDIIYPAGLKPAGWFDFYAERFDASAKTIYSRFHGPKELYASRYSTQMLRSYAKKFMNRMEEGHVIWAFFNNDIHGYAFEDAKRLQLIMEEMSH